jgi:hypothetical protein
MTQAAYEAITAEIDTLISEGYKVVIEKSSARWDHYDGLIYLVKVMDGEIIVAQAESGILSEAMGDAYGDTPER